jgi:hypothetical protein
LHKASGPLSGEPCLRDLRKKRLNHNGFGRAVSGPLSGEPRLRDLRKKRLTPGRFINGMNTPCFLFFTYQVFNARWFEYAESRYC